MSKKSNQRLAEKLLSPCQQGTTVMTRRLGGLFAHISIWGILSVSSIAQTSSGQISGRVVDSSGAAISGAMVTLTNQTTSEIRTDKTEGSGEFVFVAVQPGTFTVTITEPN